MFCTNRSVFYLIRGSDQRVDFDRASGHGIEDKFLIQFRDYYHKLSPAYGFFLKLKELTSHRNLIITIDQIISFDKLTKSEYYNDFLKPQSLQFQMVIHLKFGQRFKGIIAFWRSRNEVNFSSQDKAKAQLILPLLAGAMEKAIILEQNAELKNIINFITSNLPYKGIIVLNDSLEPIYINEYAANLISVLRKEEGIKETSSRFLPNNLYLYCRKFMNSPSTKGDPHHHQKQFQLTTKSYRQQVSVGLRCINDGHNPSKYLVSLDAEKLPLPRFPHLIELGLTRREIEVINLVFQGHTNASISDNLYISEYTVENHLRSVYEKVGVTNRTGLIYRLILGTLDEPSINSLFQVLGKQENSL